MSIVSEHSLASVLFCDKNTVNRSHSLPSSESDCKKSDSNTFPTIISVVSKRDSKFMSSRISEISCIERSSDFFEHESNNSIVEDQPLIIEPPKCFTIKIKKKDWTKIYDKSCNRLQRG